MRRLREHWLTILVVLGILGGLWLGVQRQNDANKVAKALNVEVARNRAERLKTTAAQCDRGDLLRSLIRLDASKNAKDATERRAVADRALPLHNCAPRADGKFPELGPQATAAKLAAFEKEFGK